MCNRFLFPAFAAFLFLVIPASGQDLTIAALSNVEFQDVKSTGFVLNSRQQVTVSATLLENQRKMPSPSTAWIIDGITRQKVWESDVELGKDVQGPLVVHSEALSLPAGPYEMYFASYIDWRQTGRWKNVKGLGDMVSTVLHEIFDGGKWQGWDDIEDNFEDYGDRMGIVVRGHDGNSVSNPVALSEEFLNNAFLTITGVGDESYIVEGFEVTETMDIEVYSIGEIEREGEYDYGWILNADTRETVWSMNYDNSGPAGGAWKNRLVRTKLRLDPGSYAAFYVTDGSHSADEWNAPPPYDPDFWGLTLKVMAERNLDDISRFEYENVNLKNAVVALRQVRDDEHRSAGFTLKRDAPVRIYAVGEGRSDKMFDYAWIVDAATRKRVWTMEYRGTVHAGGSSKNRLFDGTIRLPAGNYIVHYATDDSHSYEDWNSDRPYDAGAWGVTILPATRDRADLFEPYDEFSDDNVLARIAAVRDDAYKRVNFTINEDTRVRIYALGEGDDNEMFDYGWIESSRSGRVVWEMTYRMSEHAGGANKNRMVNNIIGLPAGSYTVYFQTDDSHAFGDWNASAPSDPENWGITVMRAGD